MPFQSQAQARFLFAKHPKVAKEFAEKTPNIGELPQHIDKEKEGKNLVSQLKAIQRNIGTDKKIKE